MRPLGRREATTSTKNRGQTGQTLRQRRLDSRPQEVERRTIRLGSRPLGKTQARQDMGSWSLEKNAQGLRVGEGTLAMK